MITPKTARFTRRSFLVAGPFLVPSFAFAQNQSFSAPAAVSSADAFPSQDPQLAYETVVAAHGNIGRVRELIGARPELAKAGIDWGFGDWETALDGAAHIGARDIAQLLIEAGARPTIFSAAMLGQVDVVKGFLTASPSLARLRGPHGITLMRHAQAGGAPAEAVVEYLRTVPGTDDRLTNLPVPAEQADRLVGVYDLPAIAGEPLTVARQQQGQLSIARGRRAPRNLMHQGGLEFSPAGAASVRIRFAMAERSVTMTIQDGGSGISGARRT